MFKSFKNGMAWCAGAYAVVFVTMVVADVIQNYEVELKFKNTDKESE